MQKEQVIIITSISMAVFVNSLLSFDSAYTEYDDDDDDHSDSSDSSDSSDHSDSDDSSDSSKSDTTHRRRCPNLKHPKYGKVYVQCYYYNCWATYSCNYGYTLKGSKKIKCKYNGYWSDYPPKCVYGY